MRRSHARPASAASRRASLVATGLVLVLPWATSAGRADERVVVDVQRVLADVSHKPIGVNIDYWTDDDRNALLPARRLPLARSLRELGARYLRYPGGWKADVNLWSIPPYERSDPRLARTGPNEWPGNAGFPVNADGSWKLDPLDFDEFMAACQAVDAVPTVVVPLLACVWKPTSGGTMPSCRALLEASVAWVKYANVTKRYGVKYWEIGNETYKDLAGTAYGDRVREYARAMKAVDPTIQVGASGDHERYFDDVLSRSADEVDFLVVHPYPYYHRTFAEYVAGNISPFGQFEAASRALAKLPARHRDRIGIAATEFAAGFYTAGDATGADTARGVMTFDLQGQLLQNPKIVFSQFWTTRNIYELLEHGKDPSPHLIDGVFDALRPDGTLSANGLALSIWARNLERTMVHTSSTTDIRVFATRTPGRALKIFLVNKASGARDVVVTLRPPPPGLAARAERWVYRGATPADHRPTWTRSRPVRVSDGSLRVPVGGVSITMLALVEAGSIP